MAAAYDFVTPYWMPEKECKLEFYRKQDELNKKLDEANKDFLIVNLILQTSLKISLTNNEIFSILLANKKRMRGIKNEKCY